MATFFVPAFSGSGYVQPFLITNDPNVSSPSLHLELLSRKNPFCTIFVCQNSRHNSKLDVVQLCETQKAIWWVWWVQPTPKYGGYPLIRFWQFRIWQPESSFLIYSHPGLSENIPHLWCFVNFWKTQPTPKYGGYPLIRFWQFWNWQPGSSFLIFSHPGLSENIPHYDSGLIWRP